MLPLPSNATASICVFSRRSKILTTKNDLPEAARTRVFEFLNPRPADAINFQTQTKQAHWKVRGLNCRTIGPARTKLAITDYDADSRRSHRPTRPRCRTDTRKGIASPPRLKAWRRRPPPRREQPRGGPFNDRAGTIPPPRFRRRDFVDRDRSGRRCAGQGDDGHNTAAVRPPRSAAHSSPCSPRWPEPWRRRRHVATNGPAAALFMAPRRRNSAAPRSITIAAVGVGRVMAMTIMSRLQRSAVIAAHSPPWLPRWPKLGNRRHLAVNAAAH